MLSPETNNTRWALAGLIGIGLALLAIGGAGVVLIWIGGGLVAVGALLIGWQEWGRTITPRGFVVHQEGPVDDPDGKYPYGYVLVVHPEHGHEMSGNLRLWCDAPIFYARIEIERQGERIPGPWRRPNGYFVRFPSFGICEGAAFHMRVFSRKPIRTIRLAGNKARRSKSAA